MEFNDLIERRLSFLLAEAKSHNPTYDQAVRYAFRCVSNYATVSSDGDVKKLNPVMSRAAYELALSTPVLADWKRETINEHSDELNLVWKWVIANAKDLEPVDIYARLRKSPFTTITKEENRRLERRLDISPDAPNARYLDARVEVGTADGLWKGNKLTSPVPVWTAL